MKVVLVDYKKIYKKECCNMIENTWAFHKLLSGVKEKRLVYEGFFDMYLIESTYKKVAIDKDGNVLGYLLGQNKQKKNSISLTNKLFVKLIYLFYVLVGKFGNRNVLSEILKLQNKAYNEVIPPNESFDSEIVLFFVSEKARGLGVGRLLINDYLDNYCQANNLKTTILFTDESSTYSFYEKFGFKRYKTTEYSEKLKKVEGDRAFSYIYNSDGSQIV